MRVLPLAWLLLASTLTACGGGSDNNLSNDTQSSVSSSEQSSASSSSDAPTFELPVTLTDKQAILFYQRPDANYDGWGLHLWNDEQCAALAATATEDISWDAPLEPTGIDDTYGAYYLLNLKKPAADNSDCINFIVHKGDNKALGDTDLRFDLNHGAIALSQDGTATLTYPQDTHNDTPLPFTLKDNQAALFYSRPDGEYEGWGLHLFNSDSCNALADNSINNVTWDSPKQPDGIDSKRGAFFIMDLNKLAGCFNFIVHKGDKKALGDKDLVMDLTQGNIAYTEQGSAAITYTGEQGPAQITQSGYAAHWVDANTLLWTPPKKTAQVALYYNAEGTIKVADNHISGGQSINLAAGTLSAASAKKFPHLQDLQAWSIATDSIDVDKVLAGELAVAAFDSDGALLKVTNVQTAGALDAYYATDAHLGAWISANKTHFALWAPTAQKVKLQLYANDSAEQPASTQDLTRNNKGVWSYTAAENLHGQYYRYQVSVYNYLTDKVETQSVTDPYSLNLSQNSRLSQVVDLNRSDTMNSDWSSQSIPALAHPEDSIIYELHIRDFSALDASTPAAHRGKYLAFTDTLSAPVKHLKALQQAGLNTVHLLPTFDIASVNENPAKRVDITDTVGDLCAQKPDAKVCAKAAASMLIKDILASYDPASADAQALMNDLRGVDSFNWGYDPFHYTTPEGSYATSTQGFTRIREFRAMVSALHNLGLRVVMDVVYNHTNGSGLANTSVLDKIVPGYYHRRNELSGDIENSSCCANTASEHTMMEKLLVDSMVVWARDYKIDGFRFDIMGHHMKRNILAARQAVQAVDPDNYVYGEGWNFGEVKDNRRGINATQINMAGTGVGTFNDRIRDGVRGGAPFDSGQALRANQGYGTGLYYYPNNLNKDASAAKAALTDITDRLRVNLAASLKNFSFTDHSGAQVTGSQVPYFDLFAGYTEDPQESINYISAHDNQTLWDNLQYKAAHALTSAERVRMHDFALSIPMLAEGIPFIHMGAEMLRSKSMQRDSYDSGDWFNRVDFTGQSNNWNVGLPRKDKDGASYELIGKIISDPNAKPSAADIARADAVFKEWLHIRTSSPLFRLTSAKQIESMVQFHNTGPAQIPGVIVMSLTDSADLDPQYAAIVVVFNPSASTQEINSPIAGHWAVHPVQEHSADPQTRSISVTGEQLSVPALTTAVFVKMD